MLSSLLYELRRIRSIRATWIVSGIYLVSVGLLGALPIYLGRHDAKSFVIQSWKGLYNTPANFLSVVLLSVIASQSFGHEYRYGTIRLTLSEFPRRERVIAAKSVVLAGYVILMTFLAWSVLGLVGRFAPAGSMDSRAPGFILGEGVPADLWKVLVYGLGYAFIAFSISTITKNLALGIVIPLLLATVIEGLFTLINTLLNDRLLWLLHALPISNANAWLYGSQTLPHGGLVFAIWVLALYAGATALFVRRDA